MNATANTTTDLVFLDANIIMELFFNRVRRPQVLRAMEQADGDVRFLVSILSVDVLFYHVEAKHLDKASAHAFLGQYGLLDMNEADYLWAQANDQGDFEDALQVACALRHSCQKFLTLDQRLKKHHHQHIAVTLIR